MFSVNKLHRVPPLFQVPGTQSGIRHVLPLTEVKPVGSEGHHSCNITVRLPHVVNRTLVSSCCENSVNTHNSNLVCYTSRRWQVHKCPENAPGETSRAGQACGQSRQMAWPASSPCNWCRESQGQRSEAKWAQIIKCLLSHVKESELYLEGF